jgi:hypothetical protein
VAVRQPINFKLRPFRVQYIPQLAAIVPDLLLLRLVKLVKPRGQRVTEILHVAGRMEGLPRTNARLPLAGLEDEEQGIQAGDYLCEWKPQQSLGRFLVAVQEVL